MLTIRHWRAGMAWMACIAILLASFMPSISSVFRAQDVAATALHEICTGEGLKTIALAQVDEDGHGPAKHQGHGQDCPYCRLQSDIPALLPSFDAVLHPLIAAASYPPLFYAAPERLFVWLAANPRAPPRFS